MRINGSCHRTDCQVLSGAQLKPARQVWQRSAMPWLHELDGIPGTP